MTRSLKKLALSLVIATSVTATSFADGSRFFDLEGSGIYQARPNLEVSTIFNNPVPRKLDDSFNLEKIAQSKIFFDENQVNSGSFLGLDQKKPEIDDGALIKDIENAFFVPSGDDAEKTAKFKQEAEDRKTAEKLRQDNAIAHQMLEDFLQQQAAKRVAAEAPSYLQVLGGYAYSAGGFALSGLDYAARSLPGAYLATCAGIELLEEATAYMGYATAAGLGTWYSSGSLTAGQAAGNTAYYGIKGGFKVAHTIFPYFEGAVAAFLARDAKAIINVTLDAAPAVVNGAVSATTAAVSYIRSFWA